MKGDRMRSLVLMSLILAALSTVAAAEGIMVGSDCQFTWQAPTQVAEGFEGPGVSRLFPSGALGCPVACCRRDRRPQGVETTRGRREHTDLGGCRRDRRPQGVETSGDITNNAVTLLVAEGIEGLQVLRHVLEGELRVITQRGVEALLLDEPGYGHLKRYIARIPHDGNLLELRPIIFSTPNSPPAHGYEALDVHKICLAQGGVAGGIEGLEGIATRMVREGDSSRGLAAFPGDGRASQAAGVPHLICATSTR